MAMKVISETDRGAVVSEASREDLVEFARLGDRRALRELFLSTSEQTPVTKLAVIELGKVRLPPGPRDWAAHPWTHGWVWHGPVDLDSKVDHGTLGTGRIKRVTKTRIHVEFPDGKTRTFAHAAGVPDEKPEPKAPRKTAPAKAIPRKTTPPRSRSGRIVSLPPPVTPADRQAAQEAHSIVTAGHARGEDVPTILESLRRHGFLFHGSPTDFETIEPRQAHDTSKPGGNLNAVYMSELPLESLFAAVTGKRSTSGFGTSRDSGGGLSYDDVELTADEVMDGGFVYVVPRADHFSLEGGDWTSPDPVHPVLKLSVTRSDLPYDITTPDGVNRASRRQTKSPAPASPRKAATPKARPPAKPVDIHTLFDADDATIEAALRDVYEGKFGPYTTKVKVYITRAGTRIDKKGREHRVTPSIGVDGDIFDASGHKIGYFGRSIGPVELHYPSGGDQAWRTVVRREVWAEHAIVQLGGGDGDTRHHGKGFGGAFNQRAIEWYRASGVHGISQSDHNGYVWASQGFSFRGGVMPDYKQEELQSLVAALRARKTKNKWGEAIPKGLRDALDLDEQIREAEELLARLATTKPGEPGYPTAYEVSQLGRRGRRGKTATWLGKFLGVSADEMILNPDEGEILP